MRLVLVLAIAALACNRDSAVETAARVSVHSAGAYDSVAALRRGTETDLCDARVSSLCTATSFVAAAVNDAGNLLLQTTSNRRSQLYLISSSTGAVLALGRAGGGPGEYQTLMRIGFTPSGDVVGFDPMQRRVVRFAPDGRTLSTSTVPMPSGFIDAAFVQGQLWAVGTEPTARSGDSAAVSIFALDSGASNPRRVATLPVRRPSYRMGDMIRPSTAFEARPEWAFLGDGRVVYAGGAALRLDVFDSLGVYEAQIGFDHTPREVTEADRERARASGLRLTSPLMQRALDAATAANANDDEPRHPAITALRAAHDGSVWVREAPRPQGDSVQWIGFTPTFEPLGRIVLSASDRVLAIRGLDLLVTNDESETESGDLRWVRFVLPPS